MTSRAGEVPGGHPATACGYMTTADLRRALELWAKVPHPYNEIQFERSLALALLAGLGGDAKSGMTAAETRTFADPSSALADVAKTGWALPSELKEPDFDALHGCPDFQKLVTEKAEKPPETAPTPREKK